MIKLSYIVIFWMVFIVQNISAQIKHGDTVDGKFKNPVLFLDAPDPSVIRVGNVYYMVSTTMHMSPGCTIMKSFDLVNWEVVNYAYDQLEESDEFSLKNGKNDYAAGSWAANLRYDKYEKKFYVIVTCNTTNLSYIFSTSDIEKGPWHRNVIEKCYDPGFIFEDTGTKCIKYIVNPSDDLNKHEVYLRKFFVDKNNKVILENPRVIIKHGNIENPAQGLRAEGCHGYKIGEYYYIFMIQGAGWQRQEIVWRSKTLEPGSFEVKRIFTGNIRRKDGKDIYPFTGIAQGGIVDTDDGKWYAFLFQDYGSVGRMPVLIPLVWEDGWPVLGNAGLSVDEILPIPKPGQSKRSVVVSDEFNNGKARKVFSDRAVKGMKAGISVKELDRLAKKDPSGATLATRVALNEYDYNGSNLGVAWQWNHNPNNNLWSLTDRKGFLRLKSGLLTQNIQQARNTLTQRTYGPTCTGNIAIEIKQMKDGDVAGLSAFQNQYGFVGVKMRNGQKYVVMQRAQQKNDADGIQITSIPIDVDRVYLKVDFDFREMIDKAYFFYSLNGKDWLKVGDTLQMHYDWPHFVGYRFGIFYYSTLQLGGFVDVDYFRLGKEIQEK